MKKFFLTFIILFLFYKPAYSAVDFDGLVASGDDVLTCGTNDTLLQENSAQSVSLWMFPDSVGENSFGRIIHKGDSATGDVFYHLSATAALSFRVNGGTQLVRISNNGSVRLGQINQIIFTWDGGVTAANSHIYVANQNNNWISTEVSYATTTNGVTPTDNGATTIRIGNNQTGSRTFDGWMTEIAVYNKELSSAERTQIVNGGNVCKGTPLLISGLVGYWPMDEGIAGTVNSSSGYVKDKSSGGNDCTQSNNPVYINDPTNLFCKSTLFSSTHYDSTIY